VAIIRTSDKRKFDVEVSARKVDEEIVRVGGRAIRSSTWSWPARTRWSTSTPTTSCRSKTTI